MSAVFLGMLPVLFLFEAFATDGVYAPLDIAYRWEPLASYRKEYGIGEMRTPLLVDVVDQHIPSRKAVREAVKNGRLPLWNRFQLGGEPLLAVQMSQVLWPGTWLGFALPLAQAWTFDMALRMLLALLSAYLLLRDMDCSEVAACFGATAWALCDFLVFSIGYPHGAGAAALPLLVLGLRRIALTNGDRGLGVAVAATALIISAGHPETSLHAIAAAGLFFLVALLREPTGRRLRPIRKALMAGVLGAALMGFTLAPFLQILPHTFEYGLRSDFYSATRKSVPLLQSVVNLENQLVPYSQGVSGHSLLAGNYEASAYAGSLVLLFALVGLRSRSKDRLPLIVVGTLAIVVAIGMPGVADAVGRLPLFKIAINQRLVFVGAFSLAILAGLGLDVVLKGGQRRLVITAIGVSILVLGVWLERRSTMLGLKMSQGYMAWRLALELAPVLAVAGVAGFVRAPRLAVKNAWMIPLLLAALRYAEMGRLYPVAPAKAFYPPLDVLSPIDRRLPYRFAAFGLTFVPNMAALYELEDARAYEAMTLRRLVETFPLWCVPQPVWFNRVDDPLRPFLSFLNVRYFLVPEDYGTPPGWRVLKQTRAGKLLENEHVLPRAFVPQRVACTDGGPAELQAMQGINDFGSTGVAALGCATPQWRENGSARAQITRYSPDRLEILVRAEEGTLLATSVVAWPGWRVLVDGQRHDTFSYNHAFLGAAIPAGTHVVALRYRPVGALIGGAISTLSLGVLAFLVLAGRRRRFSEWRPSSSGRRQP